MGIFGSGGRGGTEIFHSCKILIYNRKCSEVRASVLQFCATNVAHGYLICSVFLFKQHAHSFAFKNSFQFIPPLLRAFLTGEAERRSNQLSERMAEGATRDSGTASAARGRPSGQDWGVFIKHPRMRRTGPAPWGRISFRRAESGDAGEGIRRWSGRGRQRGARRGFGQSYSRREFSGILGGWGRGWASAAAPVASVSMLRKKACRSSPASSRSSSRRAARASMAP